MVLFITLLLTHHQLKINHQNEIKSNFNLPIDYMRQFASTDIDTNESRYPQSR